jgi:DNA primase small subunit
MPHSVSPEAQEPEAEGNMMTDVNEDHEVPDVDDEDQDNDMTMVEAGVQGDTVVEASTNGEVVVKHEVKLEDLFADVESDEEFPSSNAQDVKMSSSPERPASPMLA